MSLAADTHPVQFSDSSSPVVELYVEVTPASVSPMSSVTLRPQRMAAQASEPEPASSVGNQRSSTCMNSIEISYSSASVVGPLPNWPM